VIGSLTALGLLHKFDILVCAEDYKQGKPAPDGFLLAAQKLGVAPEHCLVFEDTELGIRAATAAGMQSVLVAQKRSAQPPSGEVEMRENCGTGAGSET
jgi:HAD superfamily hydrolase (TIGR01509 family)